MEEESSESSDSKIVSFVRANLLIVGLLFVGIFFLGFGILQMMGQNETEIKFEEGEEISSQVSEIKVDIDGAVMSPGLYTLASDSRVADAVEAAGGLRDEADRRQVNLASRVTDGQKIYIPEVGEEAPVLGSTTSAGESTGSISINSASQSELEGLPGIGPVRATEIIEGRPYGSIEELRSKEILGEKTYESIIDLISL